MPLYLISQHVHLYAAPDAAVLLDLKADRYTGLNREQTRALSLMVRDWPQSDDRVGINERAAATLADDLARRGVLTRDTSRGKSAKPLDLPRVEGRLCEWDGAKWQSIETAHVRRFAIAYVRAIASFHLHTLEHTIRRVEQRKARSADGRITEIEQAREFTQVFRALRPFFYTALDKCLVDSLVLVEFLAMQNVFPTWVIGVQTVPFSAHSWVQIERYVLNGSPGFVNSFSPILAI